MVQTRSIDQRLQRIMAFRNWPAFDQRRSAVRQAVVGDLVEAGASFRQIRSGGISDFQSRLTDMTSCEVDCSSENLSDSQRGLKRFCFCSCLYVVSRLSGGLAKRLVIEIAIPSFFDPAKRR